MKHTHTHTPNKVICMNVPKKMRKIYTFRNSVDAKFRQQQKVTFRIKILLLLLFLLFVPFRFLSSSSRLTVARTVHFVYTYIDWPHRYTLLNIYIVVVSGSLSRFWFSTFCDFAVNLFKNSAAKTNIPHTSADKNT